MIDTISCPRCQRRLVLPEEHLGQEVQCPACKTQFRAGEPIPVVTLVKKTPPLDLTIVEPYDAAEEPALATRRPSARRSRVRSAAPPRSRGKLFLSLGVACGLSMCCLIGYFNMKSRQPAQGIARKDLVGLKRERNLVIGQQGLRKFEKLPALPAAAVARELPPLLQAFGDAFRAHDTERLVHHFDLERMFDELSAQQIIPPELAWRRGEFDLQVRGRLSGILALDATAYPWNQFEIKKLQPLPGPEAVVIVRHTSANGWTNRMRWWLTLRQGNWRVYDYENLDTGLRLSHVAVSNLPPQWGPLDELGRSIAALREARLAFFRDPREVVAQKLQAIAAVKFPQHLEGVHCVTKGLLQAWHGRFQEALAEYEQAQRCHDDLPCLHLHKGSAYNGLRQWDKALPHLEASRALLGEEPLLCHEFGCALLPLGQRAAASTSFRKALDMSPKLKESFLGLLRSVQPADVRGDLGPRLRRLGDERQHFEAWTSEFLKHREYDALAVLAEVMRSLDPDYIPAVLAQAICRADAGRPAEAIALCRQAKLDPGAAGQHRLYLHEFLRAMANAGHAVAAYAVQPDAREAFRFLADVLRQRHATDELHELLSAHAAQHPDDPVLPFFQGEVFVQQGQYQRAEKAFTAALAGMKEPALAQQFRASRVLAHYHRGQALVAYAEIGPCDETFKQLAQLCWQERQEAFLEQLLEAHAKNQPDSEELLRNRYHLKIQQQQLPEAIALFHALLARQPTEQKRQGIVTEFLYQMLDARKPLEAYQAAPDAEHALPVLAGYLLSQNATPELRRLLQAHAQRLPGSPSLALFTGQLHLRERAWDKAAQVLAEGLPRAPADLRERYRWQYVFALFKSGKGLQAYELVPPRQQTFEQLANLYVQDKRWADLEGLTGAHRRQVGEEPELLALEARLWVFRGQVAEAAAALQQAYQAQPNVYRRANYIRAFVQDLAAAGKPLEAYRAAPDKNAAFATLAHHLLQAKQDKELSQLLEEHAKQGPDDPRLPRIQGELLLLRGQATRAAEHFTELSAKTPARERWEVRRLLLLAHIRAGQVERAYKDLGAGTRTFVDLAQQCLLEKNAEQLALLLATHRRASPLAAGLASWDMDVLWLRQDYAAVVQQLTENRAALFAASRYRWKLESYLVRGLIKLQRTTEAIKEAEDFTRHKFASPLLLVLAHAATGDVPGTIAVMEKHRLALSASACYRDHDLGPLLRGDVFRAFRERFPEPGPEAALGFEDD